MGRSEELKDSAVGGPKAMLEIPTVDWLDLEQDRDKFLSDLRYALSECGFLVLTNAPGLDDAFQQRAFREVRGFFDAPMDVKKSAHISNTPYFRGYTLPTPADRGHGQVIENFQYGFEQEPLCAHDDKSQPIHKRLFRGPNTWPKTDSLPGFQPLIGDLNGIYHRLTHQLGELIVESLGEDPPNFVSTLTSTIQILRRASITTSASMYLLKTSVPMCSRGMTSSTAKTSARTSMDRLLSRC